MIDGSAPNVENHGDQTEPALPAVIPVRNVAFTLLAIAAVIVLLQLMQSVLIPFVLGALLFYALDPAVDRLQRIHVPRALGAALMLVVTMASVSGLAYSLQGQALVVIDELPAGARRLATSARRAPGAKPNALEKVQQAADAAADALNGNDKPKAPGVLRVQVEEPRFQATNFVWTSSINIASALNQLVMILFLTYFMLLSDQLFKRKLVEVVGTLSQKKLTIVVLEEIAGQIQRFLMVQIVTSALVAVATWGALWALGLRQAALWGLLAGIFNSIPYYGPLLVTAALSVVGFLQFGTIGQTAVVAGVALLITTLEGLLLTPSLIGRTASMNQIAIFAGLLFWSWVWGAWGVLLAVPLMMIIKAICDHIEPLQPIAHFLGD